MSDNKKSVYIDWESLKLKPITIKEKKRRNLSAIGKHRHMDQKFIKKAINEMKKDIQSDLIEVDSFNNKKSKARKGRKRKYE